MRWNTIAPGVLLGVMSACAFDQGGVDFSDGGVDAPAIDADPNAPDAMPPDADPTISTTLALGDVRLVFGEQGSDTVQSFRWRRSDGGWSMEQPAVLNGRTPIWTVNSVSPAAQAEELMMVETSSGASHAVAMMRWELDHWAEDWGASGLTLKDHQRSIALTHELDSGDALAVYSDGSDTPVFRTRSGGVWSDAASLPLNDGPGPNSDTNLGAVEWIELAARPGTDEVAVVFSDSNRDLVAVIWNGDAWVTESAKVLELDLKRNNVSMDTANRSFDAAYATQSGELLVAWSRNGVSDFYFSLRRPVTGQWFPDAQFEGSVFSGQSHFIELAPDPASDRIAAAFYDLGEGTERLGAGMWSGTAWENKGELDSQMRDVNDVSNGDLVGAVGWVGETGVAIAAYPDNQVGTVDWVRWDSTNGWTAQLDVAFGAKAFSESFQLAQIPGEDRILLVVSDANSRLFATTYNGSDWQLSNVGQPLTTMIGSVEAAPFSLAPRTQ